MPTGVTESPAARGSRRSQIPIFSGSPNPRFAGAAVVARGGHGRGHDRRHDHHETRSDGRSNHHHRPSPLRPARRDDAPTETMTADRTKTAAAPAAAASMAAQSQRQTDIDGGASAFEYDDYDDDGGADTSSLYDLSSDSGDEDRGVCSAVSQSCPLPTLPLPVVCFPSLFFLSVCKSVSKKRSTYAIGVSKYCLLHVIPRVDHISSDSASVFSSFF